MGDKTGKVEELCRIYEKMDEKGKEKMVSVVEEHLKIEIRDNEISLENEKQN